MATRFFPSSLAVFDFLNPSILILELELTEKLRRRSLLNQMDGHIPEPLPCNDLWLEFSDW